MQTDSLQITGNAVLSMADTLKTSSLFKDHLLTAKDHIPKIHYTVYDYWVAGILFFSFVLFVWLYVTNRKRLNQLIKGFYINRFANQLSRDEFSLTNRVSVFLWVLFILTLTLFVSEIINYFKFPMPSDNIALSYLIIILSIALVYAIKVISIKLFGFIFQVQKEASEYILMVFLFVNTLGVFLLPVVICIAFFEQISPINFIYAGFGITALFLITRIVNGIIIGFNNVQFSKVYLFLYLCTLEILPFVIIVKLFLLNVK